jgi:hypothetical protein
MGKQIGAGGGEVLAAAYVNLARWGHQNIGPVIGWDVPYTSAQQAQEDWTSRRLARGYVLHLCVRGKRGPQASVLHVALTSI